MNFTFVKRIQRSSYCEKHWLKFISKQHWDQMRNYSCKCSLWRVRQWTFFHLNDFVIVIDSNGTEVTVVYFRAGYEPGHYPTANEWDARYLVEKSLAIKCPSINYHLAGTKKVQQALAKPGILNRFLTDEIKIKTISNIFTGLYSMDSNSEDGQNAFKMVLTNPARWSSLR